MKWTEYYNNEQFTLNISEKEKFTVADIRIPQLIVRAWVNSLLAEPPLIQIGEKNVLEEYEKDYKKILTLFFAIGELFVLKEEFRLTPFNKYDHQITYSENDDGELTFFEVQFTDTVLLNGVNKQVYCVITVEGTEGTNRYEISRKYYYNDNNRQGAAIFELEGVLPVVSPVFPVKRLSYSLDTKNNVPVYYGATKMIADCQTTYAEMMLDMYLGRKMVFLPEQTSRSLTKQQEDDFKTNLINPTQAPNVFRSVGFSDAEGIVPQIYDSPIRPDNYISAINTQLNFISLIVGFGTNYLSFEKRTGLKTATEVMADRTDINIMRKNLLQYLEELINWIAESDLLTVDSLDISFYDNIIEDDSIKKKQLYMDMSAGFLDLRWYLKEMYDLDEADITIAMNKVFAPNE